MSFETFFYALLGGVLPAIVWLIFWLREDRKNPEPNNLILKTFLLGMFSVILVLPFQKGVDMLLPNLAVFSIILWAVLEEVFKFGAGYFGGLHTVEDNEPVDPIIYMITAALGFVALENSLFIFGPLSNNDISQSIITGNLRFIGASLLHVVASGLVGVGISFSFYQSRLQKIVMITLALFGAIAFHVLFNFLIIAYDQLGTTLAFVLVWLGVGFLLLAFERAKRIAPQAPCSYN